jgi:hypothetical protein
MSFIRDFNRDLSEIKYELVKWFRPIQFGDIIDFNLENYDLIQFTKKDEGNEVFGLVIEIIGDRMLIYKKLDSFELDTIYPEEIEEINLVISKRTKEEIKKNQKAVKEVILDYPLIIENWIKNR